MTMHNPHQRRSETGGILDETCERCAQYAENPAMLDSTNLRSMWDQMMAVEFGTIHNYPNTADAKAGRVLYRMAVALELLGHDPRLI
jgi:hypothetical protein